MGTEIKSGKKVESKLALSLKKKFTRTVKKNGTSEAQAIRDLIQGYVKR